MVHSTNRFYLFFLLTTLILFQGCVIIETPPHPKTWPHAAHRDNTNHWSGYIPVNSLQQLSEIYKSQDFISYQQKGYRPYLKVTGVWIADLLLVDSAQSDTILIWTTRVKGPFKWDDFKKIKVKVSNDEIIFFTKIPKDVFGWLYILTFERNYIKIYKSANDDLLIRSGMKFYGMLAYIYPVIDHSSTWHLYAPDL
jgi:hypothetical protein